MRTPTSPRQELQRSTEAFDVQAERGYSAYRDADGTLIERQQEVVEDTAQRRSNLRSAMTSILSLLFGALEVILLLRLVFRLLGANTQSEFISWLYGVSHPFVVPFNGIFNDQALGSRGVFEVSTLIAVLIYGLLAWGVTTLVDAALRSGSARRKRLMEFRRRQL